MSEVVLGFVAGDMVVTRFMMSVMGLMRHDHAHRRLLGDGDHLIQEGCFIDNNRDKLAENLLKSAGEWLLTLDTDVSFGPDLLDLMLDSAKQIGAPILSALYVTWMGDGKQLCPVWLVNREDGLTQTVAHLNDGPQELDAIGLGACLIHRSVFEKMKAEYEAGQVPWANSPWIWFGRDRLGKGHLPTSTGEDVTFCRRAKACGFKIWGDSRIEVTHLKRTPLNYETLVDAQLVRQAKAAVAAEQKQAA